MKHSYASAQASQPLPARHLHTRARWALSVCTLCALNMPLHADNLHNYFWFNYQLSAGKINEANTWFAKNLQTAPVHVYKGYTQLLHAAGKHQAIAALIPSLDAHFATDPDMQLIFYQALAHTGDTQGAHTRLMQISKQFKTNQEIAYIAAQTYMANHEPANALTIIDEYLNSTPPKSNNFVFHFLKAQILMSLDKKPEALVSIKKSVRIQPRFDAAWLLNAVLEEQTEHLPAAIKAYTTYLELTGGNDLIEKHLLSIFFKHKIAQHNNQQLLLPTHCLEKAVALFEQKKYHQGLQELEQCLGAQSAHGATTITKAQAKNVKK